MQLNKGDYLSPGAYSGIDQAEAGETALSYPSAAVHLRGCRLAGKLIQDAGLKGMRVGDAQISEKHSGFIINLGNATACDVIKLIEKAKIKVKEQTGVELHPEVRIVGED